MIVNDLLALGTATAALGLAVLARADRGAEDGQGEPNTYGLPEGEPISAELKTWFKLQKTAVLDAIPDTGPLPEAFPDLAGDDWTDPMKTAMTPLVGAYWDESGKEVYARLGLDPGDWRVVNPHLRHQIERQSFNFCKATNQSTSKRLDRALEQMKAAFVAGLVEEGETLPQLTRRVEGIFGALTRSHAGMIAATEASRAVHAAQLQADVDSEVVAGLELLLSADACPLCRKVATECKRVRLGQSFAVIGEHPEYSHIKFPPIHPRCQCTAIEVLLPAYGGPEKVEWGHTLIQPQKDLKDGYTPPAGKPEAKPEPKKAEDKPTFRKPIDQRLAAYKAGDAKIALIQAIGDEITRLEGSLQAISKELGEYAAALTPEEWVSSNAAARPKRDAIMEMESKMGEAMGRLHEARRTAAERVLQAIEVPADERIKLSGSNLDKLSPEARKKAKPASAALERLVHGPGIEVEHTWRNFARGEKRREYCAMSTRTAADGTKTRTSEIVIGSGTSRPVIVHELCHSLEWQVPGLHERIQEFRTYRVGSETPISLKAKFPDSKYEADEIGCKDQFDRYFAERSAYYCGKVYRYEGSEILTMGVQALFENPHKFVTKDPEYAKFVLGILDGSLR